MEQLPEGWVKCKSKKYRGKPYYFNVRTGETTWTVDKISTSSSNPSNTSKISPVLGKNLKTPAQDRLKRLQSDLKQQRESAKKSAIPRVVKRTPCITEPTKQKSWLSNGKTEDKTSVKRFPKQKPVSTKTRETEQSTFQKIQAVIKEVTEPQEPTEKQAEECDPSVKSETATENRSQKNIVAEKQKAEPVVQAKVKRVDNLLRNDLKKSSRKASPKTVKKCLKKNRESPKLKDVRGNNNRKRKSNDEDRGTTNKISRKSISKTEEVKEIVPSSTAPAPAPSNKSTAPSPANKCNAPVPSNKCNAPAYNFNPPNSRDELTVNCNFHTSLINTKPKSANERLENLRKLLAHNREVDQNNPRISGDTTPIKEDHNVINNELPEPTPMDWEDIEVNTEISDIRQDKMADYYDVVSHNLFKIASENEEKKSSELSRDWYYFIIDTNVFLSNLKFIDDLTKLKPPGTTGVVIYVPYCVLQELDKLKSRNTGSTSTFAIRAIKYLNGKFSSTESCVKGQSAIEAKNRLIKILNADDEIINCCLQLKEITSNVMLLSNDVNLRNKAICNNILASTKSDLESDNVADT